MIFIRWLVSLIDDLFDILFYPIKLAVQVFIFLAVLLFLFVGLIGVIVA